MICVSMKNNKQNIIFCIVLVASIVVSFGLGFAVGKNYKQHKKQKKSIVKFFQSNKHVGKELTKEEKQGVRYFIVPYEECLGSTLDVDEKNEMLAIQKDVIDLAKDNNKVKINLDKLKSAKDKKVLIKKIKKCQKQAYKNMTKENKKNMRKGIKKMDIVSIISMFHGVK